MSQREGERQRQTVNRLQMWVENNYLLSIHLSWFEHFIYGFWINNFTVFQMLRCRCLFVKTTKTHDARTQQGFTKIYSQFYVMSFTCITFLGNCVFVYFFFLLLFSSLVCDVVELANVIFVTWIEKDAFCMCENDGNAFNFDKLLPLFVQ